MAEGVVSRQAGKVRSVEETLGELLAGRVGDRVSVLVGGARLAGMLVEVRGPMMVVRADGEVLVPLSQVQAVWVFGA